MDSETSWSPSLETELSVVDEDPPNPSISIVTAGQVRRRDSVYICTAAPKFIIKLHHTRGHFTLLLLLLDSSLNMRSSSLLVGVFAHLSIAAFSVDLYVIQYLSVDTNTN